MKKDIIFTLPAEALEGATEVIILGDFNNWSPTEEYKLERQEDGTFKTIVSLEEGRTYQYRFLLNDGRWVNDYHAQNYVPVYDFFVDNCVITVPETSNEQVKEKNTSEQPEQEKKETMKNEKTLKEKTSAKPESAESKSKKPASSKAAKEKPVTDKVKEKKSEKTEKAAKKTKKETTKK